jgi:hypothetical protein
VGPVFLFLAFPPSPLHIFLDLFQFLCNRFVLGLTLFQLKAGSTLSGICSTVPLRSLKYVLYLTDRAWVFIGALPHLNRQVWVR